MLPIAGLQRDKTHFPDPETFSPERFLTGDDGNGSHAGTFLAWGIGPRKCLGKADVALIYDTLHVKII